MKVNTALLAEKGYDNMNDALYRKAVELRHRLHEKPELSNEETETKRTLMAFLAENAPELELHDRGKWFYAAYRSDNPAAKTIAFRADFDAIPVEDDIDAPWRSQNPGVGHKCGHDGHSATLAGFAADVWEHGADNNVIFVFQHAEEIGDGAKYCCAVMEEEKVDEVYAYHNSAGFEKDLVVVKPGINNCASEGMEISFTGTPAPASQPENGKNPALAVCNIVQAIPDMIAPGKYEGLVLCTVIQIDVGERAFGCSASKGKLLLTLRAQNEPELDDLQKALEDLAAEQAKQYGLEIEFTYHDVFPETRSWPEGVERVKAACDAVGQKWFERKDFQRGSEDFGYFMKNVPGAYFIVGNGEDAPAIHTSKFDFPDNQIRLVDRVFGQLAGIRK